MTVPASASGPGTGAGGLLAAPSASGGGLDAGRDMNGGDRRTQLAEFRHGLGAASHMPLGQVAEGDSEASSDDGGGGDGGGS